MKSENKDIEWSTFAAAMVVISSILFGLLLVQKFVESLPTGQISIGI